LRCRAGGRTEPPEWLTKAKEALAIYEMIRAASEDRPFFGTSTLQLMREISGWIAKDGNR
jgi:hypothetical protein